MSSEVLKYRLKTDISVKGKVEAETDDCKGSIFTGSKWDNKNIVYSFFLTCECKRQETKSTKNETEKQKKGVVHTEESKIFFLPK